MEVVRLCIDLMFSRQLDFGVEVDFLMLQMERPVWSGFVRDERSIMEWRFTRWCMIRYLRRYKLHIYVHYIVCYSELL